MSGYCKPADHTWVAVIGGQGYSEGWTTTVCIYCHCFNGIRDELIHPVQPKRQS